VRLARALPVAFAALAAPGARAGDGGPSGPFVERVSASSSSAREPGRTTWPPGAVVRFTAHLRHAGGAPVPARGAWAVDGAPLAQNRDARAGALVPPFSTEESVRWTAAPGRHEVSVSWGGDAALVATDAVSLRLVVSREALAAGDRRHGSLLRRLRRSLDDLHACLAASRHPLAPLGALVRFRLDEVSTLDRGSDASALEPGERDLTLAFGALDPTPSGVRLPDAVVLHDALPPDAEDPLSPAGERRLWRALLETRGVPDARRWAVPAGALPGRLAGALAPPADYEVFEETADGCRVREAAAVFSNANERRARPPRADAPDGLLRTHVPGRVVLALARGRSRVPEAVVRWWRARPDPSLPEGVAGVAAGRAPDGQATTDARGLATLSGDLLGRADPEGPPSRWLLLEVETPDGPRFTVLPSLDLHLDYARGDKHATVRLVRVEDLRAPGGPSSADR
jgi:hypothetical protein